MAQRAKIVGLESWHQQTGEKRAHGGMASPGQMIEIVISEEAFVSRVVQDQKERGEGQEQN